jgi:diguanylate cyclase (GGDEF)-like protein
MASKDNLRIIIIDDNPEIHKDFIKILAADHDSLEVLDTLEQELFGKTEQPQELALPHFEIDTVTQGQEGVEHIRKALSEGRPYALAFVDIRMPPGWDGIETIKHIWELDRDIQVVICTAYSDYSWEETIEELGVNDNLLILKKPFDNISVRQLACALTKKWQLMQDSRQHMQSLEKHIQERTDSLQKSLSLTRATLDSSTDGILVVDGEERVVDYNKNFIDLWKIPASVLESKDNKVIVEYVSEQLQDPREFLKIIKEINNHPEEKKLDTLNFTDGRIFERYSQPHKVNGKTVGRIWSFRDVTKRVYLEKKLEYQATHDALTDLPNRVLLNDRINQAIAIAKREHTLVGVLFFDLDRFKLINDSLSHQAGDELLKAFAKRVKESIREGDTLARIGGDEFVMVLPNLHKEAEAVNIANKVLNLLKEPFIIAKRKINITSSIGISLYPKNGTTFEELLKNADLAMYRSKEAGANQFQFYTESLNKKGAEYLERVAELRQALTTNELFVCYQPQVKLATRNIVAVEALVRWQHPKKGLLLPMDFIPLAEDAGLIIPMGEWVLRTACLQNKKWQDKGLPPIRVAVNLANQQIKQPNLVETIKNVLKETGLSPEYLEIELTENVLINNLEVINRIQELKAMGIQIALDDFGTGYTNINYLKKIPLNSLKIDKSLIDNIDINRSDEVIMKAIMAMADSLNFQVLAEGVETQKQLDCLRNINCETIQGFYFSKPLISEEIEKLLQNPDSFKPSEESYIKVV